MKHQDTVNTILMMLLSIPEDERLNVAAQVAAHAAIDAGQSNVFVPVSKTHIVELHLKSVV